MKCKVCGSHINVVTLGASLIELCPNCNVDKSKSTLRGFEFQYYITEFLRNSELFRDIRIEQTLDQSRNTSADIVAEQFENGIWRKVVIECKAQSTLTIERLRVVLEQLSEWKKYVGDAKLVLAFPGDLSDRAKGFVKQFDVEVWDLSYLANNFKNQIDNIGNTYFKSLLKIVAVQKTEWSIEEKLIVKLKKCAPGKVEWSKYQNLVGEILERLFVPPLSTPIKELSDSFKVNRRDFIFPNYEEEGFWAFLRNQYSADYIVVDAKNYTRKIKKQEVLQIVNYLKPYGTGLFAIIVCRNGGDSSCMHTLREVWTFQKKMIIILTDNDIEQMLKDKNVGLPPENVIRDKIRDFRLEL